MDKLKYIKLKNEDGSYSEPIPLSADGNYIDIDGVSLANVLKAKDSNLNTEKVQRQTADGNLQSQINTIVAEAGSPEGSAAELVQARTNIRNLSFDTLNDRISYLEKSVPITSAPVENVDYNDYLTPGSYVVTSVRDNYPSLDGETMYGTSGILIVEALECFNSDKVLATFPWIVQRWFPLSEYTSRGFAERIVQRQNSNPATYIFKPWNVFDYTKISRLYRSSLDVKRSDLNDNYAGYGYTGQQIDFNTILRQGNYLTTGTTNPNNPLGTAAAMITVQKNDLGPGSNQWITQTVCDIQMTQMYARVIMISNSNPASNQYRPWRKIYPQTSPRVADVLLLTGKKIVNFGDSVFGNFNDSTSISNNIAKNTNATVYNVGFGGCQMSDRPDRGWKAFSMCNLATAVATDDWTLQDAAVADKPSGMPSYFDSHLNTLKNLDFNEVDIITIAYGTNDYTAGDTLDDTNNPKNINTFAGALRYSVETILNKYPHLRVLIGTPTYRLWLSDGEITAESDTRTFGGGYTLAQMRDKILDIGKEYHIPVLNTYDDLCCTKYNWPAFFGPTDGVHPHAEGRAKVGRLYAMKLLNM